MARLKREEMFPKAYEIAGRYEGNLTVRQLYYRMVAEGHINSSQKEYKRLVAMLSSWRMSGEMPLDWFVDRTRENRPGDYCTNQDNVEDALSGAAKRIRRLPETLMWRSQWLGQRTHVSVWVEKEALAGVFEAPCEDMGVSWFVCRGYPSLSSLHQWCQHTSDAWLTSYHQGDEIEDIVILYFGDHDPDGFEIPRASVRNLHDICALEGIEIPQVRLERVALNIDQIRAFNPPPFPAKRSSSRYKSYHEEHGLNDSWELDALKPEELEALIKGSVEQYFDLDIHAENIGTIEQRRIDMREAMRSDEWLSNVLRGQ